MCRYLDYVKSIRVHLIKHGSCKFKYNVAETLTEFQAEMGTNQGFPYHICKLLSVYRCCPLFHPKLSLSKLLWGRSVRACLDTDCRSILKQLMTLQTWTLKKIILEDHIPHLSSKFCSQTKSADQFSQQSKLAYTLLLAEILAIETTIFTHLRHAHSVTPLKDPHSLCSIFKWRNKRFFLSQFLYAGKREDGAVFCLLRAEWGRG